MIKIVSYGSMAILFLTVLGCHRRTFELSDDRLCTVRFQSRLLSVSTSGSSATKAGEPVDLSAGSTVRVLAYQRGSTGQSSPDLSHDSWKASATYVVQEDGSFVPCAVRPDGTVDVGVSGSSGMELHNGTYDFYAYSPARSIESDNRTVQGICHGEDFLGSYVGSQSISRSSNTVNLEFEHEASKVTFSVVPVEGGLISKDLFADRVVLHNMATSPAGAYTIGGDLSPTLGTSSDCGVIQTFSYLDSENKGEGSTGSGIFLPKSSGEIPSEFYIRVGQVDYVLKATLPSMEFQKGHDYRFVARVKKGSVDLVLNILSWDSVDQDLSSGIGLGGPNATIQIGSWGNIDWSGALGTNPDEAAFPLAVGTWSSTAQDIDFLGSNGIGGVSGWGSVDTGTTEIGK